MGFVGVTNYKKDSERLPGKHHLEFFDGKSLVELKLEQLFSAGASHVYVSTDDPHVRDTDKVTYVTREPEYCNNVTRFTFVLEEIFNSIPISDEQNVIYTFVCCPLFNRYKELYQAFESSGKNHIAVHNSYHYYLDVNKRPINFTFGLWHPYSQGIDPVYMFPYAGTACKMGDLRQARYMIPMEFEYFTMNQFEAIDIDNLQEFELAQQLYAGIG